MFRTTCLPHRCTCWNTSSRPPEKTVTAVHASQRGGDMPHSAAETCLRARRRHVSQRGGDMSHSAAETCLTARRRHASQRGGDMPHQAERGWFPGNAAERGSGSVTCYPHSLAIADKRSSRDHFIAKTLSVFALSVSPCKVLKRALDFQSPFRIKSRYYKTWFVFPRCGGSGSSVHSIYLHTANSGDTSIKPATARKITRRRQQ